ncbi:MAG: homoprotocatechuate degradation operon regulator HpaR [Afipia sp.]
MREFSRSLPMALLRAREAVMREFRPSLRDHDMTEQQWRVLRALSTGREMEVAELANATCLLGPSLSRILRDLEERGLVTRRVPETDLRRGFVSISPVGNALIARVGPISESIYSALTRRYGAARLKLLYEMLEQLEQCLTEKPGAGNDGR